MTNPEISLKAVHGAILIRFLYGWLQDRTPWILGMSNIEHSLEVRLVHQILGIYQRVYHRSDSKEQGYAMIC